MGSRTSKQCRERWCHHLSPAINKKKFSAAEDAMLMGMLEIHGMKWSMIARHMPGRTEDMIRSRFKSLSVKSLENPQLNLASEKNDIIRKVMEKCEVSTEDEDSARDILFNMSSDTSDSVDRFFAPRSQTSTKYSPPVGDYSLAESNRRLLQFLNSRERQPSSLIDVQHGPFVSMMTSYGQPIVPHATTGRAVNSFHHFPRPSFYPSHVPSYYLSLLRDPPVPLRQSQDPSQNSD